MSLESITFTACVMRWTEFEVFIIMKSLKTFERVAGLALIVSSVASSGQSDAAEVELKITMNRESYVTREPIIIEWSITNTSNRQLSLCGFIEAGYAIRFTCSDKEGKPVLGTYLKIGAKVPEATTAFPPGAIIRGWVNLGETYDVSIGEFTLEAVLNTERFGGYKGIWRGSAKSNVVNFRVEETKGEDKKAADLIGMGVAKLKIPMTSGYLTCEEVHNAIVSLTNSPRFVPISNFYLAYNEIMKYEIGHSALDFLAIERLENCIKNTDNHYLKGLARYYRLLGKATLPWDEHDFLPVPDAEKLIKEIQKEHPNTYAAQEAPKVLEKLKAARAKKE